MNNQIIYKTLFEVKVIHDHFLMKAYRGDLNTSYFDAPPPQVDIDKVFENNLYDIREFMSISPSQETDTFLTNNNLMFVPTAFGFLIAIEVRKSGQLTGTETEFTYKPKQALSSSEHFKFLVKITKQSEFVNKSKLTVRGDIASKFYFTNMNSNGTKVLPTVSNSATGIVGIEDAKLISNRIELITESSSKLKLTLRNLNGDVVFEKTKLGLGAKEIIDINASSTYDPNRINIDNGFYDIELEYDDVNQFSDQFYIDSKSYDEDAWGLIDLYVDAENLNYNMLNVAGELKFKRTVDYTIQQLVSEVPAITYNINIKKKII